VAPDVPDLRRLDDAHALWSSRQRLLNARTDAHWALYSPHRARVAEVIGAALATHEGGRLCVLGAGNCNDLRLTELARGVGEIVLVDIDEEALERGFVGAFGQRPGERPDLDARVVLRGGVELTGIVGQLAHDSGSELSTIVEQALTAPAGPIGKDFDVVVSCCVLTQLIALPVDALGDEHPDLTRVVLAVRTGHLRLMARLLRPGGHAVLITDVVSSDTTPSLAHAAAGSHPQILAEAIADRNFFTGVNPLALLAVFSSDAWLCANVVVGELVGPWAWRVGPDRTYLVVAVPFTRR
jgi:SAM-dependent methyltransferase